MIDVESLPFSEDGNPNGPLIIVSCGAAKVWDKLPGAGPVKAEDAYVGPTYRMRRRYGRMCGRAWMILSAKYGFIEPKQLITNYGATFSGESRRVYRGKVREAPLDSETIPIEILKEQAAEIANEHTEIIGIVAKPYHDVMVKAFAGLPVHLYFPTVNLGSFQVVKWVIRHTNTMPEDGWRDYVRCNAERAERAVKKAAQLRFF